MRSAVKGPAAAEVTGRPGGATVGARATAAALLVVMLLAGCGELGPGSGAPGDDPWRPGAEHETWAAAVSRLAADSTNADAWFDFARAGLRTGRTDRGVHALATADSLRGGADWRSEVLRAEMLQRQARNVAAIEAATRATELAPAEPLAWRALGFVSLGGGVVGTADYEGAEAALRKALEATPDDRRARLALAEALVLGGRHEVAAPELANLLAADEPSARAYYLRALARMRAREMDGAVADFRAAVARDPGLHAAWFNLGRLLPRLGDPDAAKVALARGQAARAHAEQVSNFELPWYETGAWGAGLQLTAQLRRGGQYEESLHLAETLRQVAPEIPPSHLEYAESALAAGRTEAALAAAEFAAQRWPENNRAQAVLVECLVAAGHGDRALALAPNDPRALLAAGRAVDAERGFGRMLRNVEPARRGPLRIQRARARIASGAWGRAQDDLRAVLESDDTNVEAWEVLAEALAAGGRDDDANDARRRAQELKDAAEIARRAQEKTWRTDFLVP